MRRVSKALRSDLKKCEDIIKNNSKTFYKAFGMLKSKTDREAIYAIYAYCRVVDDAIDEYEDLNLLNSYKEKLDNLKKGQIPDDYIFRSLSYVFETYYPKDYDYAPYEGLICGQRQDFEFVQPKTLQSLLDYCYLVAGVVGEMLSYVLAPKDALKDVRKVAIDLGEAMQITNILRDIGEDKNRGRIYIPEDVMQTFNYSKRDLEAEVVNDNFKSMFEYLANYAQEKYKVALASLDLFKRDARKPLMLASLMYEAILNTVRQNDYDVFKKRSVVPDSIKKEIIKKVYR